MKNKKKESWNQTMSTSFFQECPYLGPSLKKAKSLDYSFLSFRCHHVFDSKENLKKKFLLEKSGTNSEISSFKQLFEDY